MRGAQRRCASLLGTRLGLWIAALAASAVLVAVLGYCVDPSLPAGFVLVGLVAVSALAERGRVRLGERLEVSISLVPTLFAAVSFGPLAGMLVSAGSMLGGFSRSWASPYLRLLNHSMSRAIGGGSAGLVALYSTRALGTDFGGIVVATLVAAVALQLLDLALAIATSWIRVTRQARAIISTLAPLILAEVPLYAPIVAALVYSYQEVSAWSLVLFFLPALAVQRLFGLYQEQRSLARDLSAANGRLERANLSFATALVATLDARDRYTAGHSAAVAIYARDIAERMQLSGNEVNLAYVCGLVHDIGKIGLPPGILEKPGPLTLSERREMERHSEIGERILSNVEDYADIAIIVRHHHERWDGQGYPDGVEKQAIPMLSRIIAVADAYNAMTSDRPYRDAMPSRVARVRLAQGVDSQFDTAVVAAFEAILAGKDEEYRMARRSDFLFAQAELAEPTEPQINLPHLVEAA